MKVRQIEIVLGICVITGIMLVTLSLAIVAIIGIEGVNAIIEEF